MTRQYGRPNASSQARLQLVLVLLGAWDLMTYLLELTNTRVLEIGGIDGILGARAVSGASAVLGIAYLYAARSPIRYRFILWMATIEQVIAVFSTAFHWAVNDLSAGESLLTIGVAAIFLALLIANMPRQTDTIGA
jgi:hypothetical protein